MNKEAGCLQPSPTGPCGHCQTQTKMLWYNGQVLILFSMWFRYSSLKGMRERGKPKKSWSDSIELRTGVEQKSLVS